MLMTRMAIKMPNIPQSAHADSFLCNLPNKLCNIDLKRGRQSERGQVKLMGRSIWLNVAEITVLDSSFPRPALHTRGYQLFEVAKTTVAQGVLTGHVVIVLASPESAP